MKKKYRWNKKTFAKNIGKLMAVVAMSVAVDAALFLAFFGEALHII